MEIAAIREVKSLGKPMLRENENSLCGKKRGTDKLEMWMTIGKTTNKQQQKQKQNSISVRGNDKCINVDDENNWRKNKQAKKQSLWKECLCCYVVVVDGVGK